MIQISVDYASSVIVEILSKAVFREVRRKALQFYCDTSARYFEYAAKDFPSPSRLLCVLVTQLSGSSTTIFQKVARDKNIHGLFAPFDEYLS